MSVKEAERLGLMREVDSKNLTIIKASERLGMSLRQTKRIRKRYLQEGLFGLLSKRKGHPNVRKIGKEVRDKVIHLIKTYYPDFGPTLAQEKLLERDKISLSDETLRKWMIEENIWKCKKKKEKKTHQRRARRSRFGELLQGDGSPHDWFEGRGEKCTLLLFVDDATSGVPVGKFAPTETTEGYLDLLKMHLNQYGRPLALYVDKHTVFRVNREELKKGVGITHFGQVLKELDIQLICAHSPEAKGKVERKNGVFQDRLIKEMRLAGISSIEEANNFLPKYLEKHNKQFGKEAACPEDAHRALRKQDNLEEIFARKDKRKLSKDLSFQHKGILYLIKTKTPRRLQHTMVDVFWRRNAIIKVEHNGEELQYKTWAETVYEKPAVLDSKEIAMIWLGKKAHKPSMKHPWR
ncbi:MAG: ISNCY family transposase [Chlamydiota bacterium]